MDPGVSTIEIIIGEAQAGLRLDRALAELCPDLSRERLKALILDGMVVTQGTGRPVTPSLKATIGQAYAITLPAPVEMEAVAQDIPLTIIFEDEYLVVVDKPAGLVVHPGAGNWSGTLMNAILHHAPEARHLARAGIVHRLDKQTSGLLVVARNETAQLDLVRQLQARTVKRTYLALARGRVTAGGTVDKPIGRHPTRRTRMAVVPAGKPAITHFRVRERFPAHTLLECDLETGRTHQIRVHLAAIGHPLEGDPEYGASGKQRFGRQALHAWKLAFLHPRTGKSVRFESPVPGDLEALFAELRA